MATAVTRHIKGPTRALLVQRGPTCSLLMHLTPACPVFNIFVLMGNIGGWGWGRRALGRRGRAQELVGDRTYWEGNRGESRRQKGGRGAA